MKCTIVGGGFGGVKAALELSKQPYNQITLITDKPDFQFYPALYSTATGRSRLQSWIPLGTIFAGKTNVDVIIDTIVKVHPDTKTISGASGNTYHYEHLILALGSVTTYFGIDGLDQYAYGIKSETEITELKHHLYKEIAEEHTVEKRYVVIGGGPTGVELAATLGTYIKRLSRRYKITKGKVSVTLVEAAPRLLPRLHPTTSKKVTKQLRKIGVDVELNKKVERATVDGITINGKPLLSHTVIWTSGVANSAFFTHNSHHFELSKNGKVVVDAYMQTKDGIYVIGDNAFTPFSGLAQTAIYDAKFISRNLNRLHQKKLPKKYHPVQPATVVPVGEKWAAMEWRFVRLYGRPVSVVRRLADAMGYLDYLPFGQALDIWRTQSTFQEDYFTPSSPVS